VLIVVFEVEEDPVSKSFFSEIISSVCDIRFSRDGRYILSRDFLTLKIWDLAMDGRTPLQTINIHDHLRHKLCDLYESDCIFDKFECTFSGDGKHALTGSYNNNFMIYPTNVGGTPGRQQPPAQEILLQADKSAFKAKKSIAAAKKAAAARGASPARGGRATPPPSALTRTALDVDSMDFNKKILHLSWHPYEDTVAIAATNNVLPSICLPGLTSAFPVLCYLSVMSRLGCIAIYVRQNSILAFSTGFGLLLFVHDGNGVMGCRLG
jgi:serine/threonine-protein phosphatase 2A regulatory subunit B